MSEEASKQDLGHIHKYSTLDYEQKLMEVLSLKMSVREAVQYRELYLGSYSQLPTPTTSISTVTINLSELCNFKCVMCDVPKNNRKSVNIELYKIFEFMEKASSLGSKCCILGSGSEITLSKDWKQIVTKSVELFPDTILFTNGSIIDYTDLDYLVEIGLTRLFISLDAATPETFKLIRGFDILSDIESKIYYLEDLKAKSDSLMPLTRVSFVTQEANAHEVDLFLSRWLGKVDSVEFQDCVNLENFKDRNYVDDSCKSPMRTITETAPPTCHRPFSYISLWASGRLSPCCTSYGRDSTELELSNINNADYMDVALEKRLKIQQAFNTGDWSLIPQTCQLCLSSTSNK
jgi:hypothetical protein